MSEEVQAPEPAPEAAPAPQALTQEEKVFHVKRNINQTLTTLHNNLFNFVKGLPIEDENRRFALANLVQALHWAEDGIELLKFEVEEAPQVPEQGEQSPATEAPQPTEGDTTC